MEILLKTPRSASSASSGSSGGTEPAAELLKLDPTSWAKWHIEMSEKLKQRKAEAAASLVKCVVPPLSRLLSGANLSQEPAGAYVQS